MAAIGAYIAAQVLNITLKQTATMLSPATLGLGLAVGAPTSLSMSELGTGSGYTPQTLSMSSVAASGTIASNAAALTFGPFSSTQAISGFVIKDTLSCSSSPGNLGNIYYFGTLATARTVSIGDSLVIAVSGLTIALA
jgi:hypothetical protein